MISTNTGARELLENAGYEAVRGTYVMEVHLEDQPPEPGWPEGLVVRTFVPGRDERAVFEAVEDAFRDVWDRPGGTFERFVAMTLNENFDPSLWFLATEGEEIAGAALCKTVVGEGWTSSACGGRGGGAVWGLRCCATRSGSTAGVASAGWSLAWTRGA